MFSRLESFDTSSSKSGDYSNSVLAEHQKSLFSQRNRLGGLFLTEPLTCGVIASEIYATCICSVVSSEALSLALIVVFCMLSMRFA